jgi:hypothetical protein
MRLPVKKFEWLTRGNPARQERLRSAGTIVGKDIDIPDPLWLEKPEILRKADPIPVPPPIGDCSQQKQTRQLPEEPKLTDMAGNLASALVEWAAAGFRVANQAEVEDRAAICRQCDLWDPNARKGWGKCMSKLCGCTKLKWWLSTSICPEGKWRSKRV